MAEFSTLEVSVLMACYEDKVIKLKLKQLLGTFQLDIWLPLLAHFGKSTHSLNLSIIHES